jgi:hypothetical protein
MLRFLKYRKVPSDIVDRTVAFYSHTWNQVGMGAKYIVLCNATNVGVG